jgi:pantetheine-phosphate adenylyltransferase
MGHLRWLEQPKAMLKQGSETAAFYASDSGSQLCGKLTWAAFNLRATIRRRLPSANSPKGLTMAKRAIYPGTFDPLTNGHVDIIARGCQLFDEVIVALLVNPGKSPLFTVPERVEILTEVLTPKFPQVRVETFEGLLVDYCRQREVNAIIRGVRSFKDYEYELPMVLMNRRLNPKVETVLLVASEENSYVSSSLIKEVFNLGGSIDGLVPDLVIERMKQTKSR